MAETKSAAAKAVVKEAAKTEVKEAVKTAEKAVEAKAEEKKPAVKKTTAKKTTTKTAAEKKTAEEKKPAAKKATAKKAEVKTEVNIQFDGKNYTTDDILKIAQDVWKYDLGKKATEMKKVELYVKPEESQVYYVFNGEVTGSFSI
ncbi:MAG: hypothetical protein E7294_03025 [Lachnospiraceae bacterium]|jgi:undecaprenyl pyrophosphate synthase|nr:hypothetical protein [Lachnospiraceae bacterium]